MKNFKFGVLGHNISYSLSPRIFDTIFEYVKLNGETSILDWNSDELKVGKKELLEYDGLSITIPYKTEIISYLDHIKYPADLIQSVNSVHIIDNKMIGYNTDYKGFVFALDRYSDLIKNRNLLLYGFGGSARAILYGLVEKYKVSHVEVVIRDYRKRGNIKDILNNIFPDLSVSIKTFDDKINLSRFSLIINSTPLGGVNHPDNLPFGDNSDFNGETLYYDLNYNDGNKAIAFSKENNMIIIDGKQMLIAQAIESFKLWTSIDVPFAYIYEKIFPENTK